MSSAAPDRGPADVASRDEILAQVQAVLRAEFQLSAEEVAPEAHLVDDLDLDSVDAVALLAVHTRLSGDRHDRRPGDRVELQLAELAVRRAADDVAELAVTLPVEGLELVPRLAVELRLQKIRRARREREAAREAEVEL